MKDIALIGYSGHAFVALEAFVSQARNVTAYVEASEKQNNPYDLTWLGSENDKNTIGLLKEYEYFVGIGDNLIRRKVTETLSKTIGQPLNAIHRTAIVSSSSKMGEGNLLAAGCVINPQVRIGNGVICNTGSIIEHDCALADFVHVAPGAVLCGNISVGENSFIGANAVVKEGVRIGKNVIIGAGTVVIADVANGKKLVGNPQRML
jgi:sugar O-acyltransferase (sialic acid O-acetyltransferase NeuD family)